MEKWLSVVGYEGKYSVSNLGNVRSEAREVPHSHSGKISIPQRILKPFDNNAGYLTVTLCSDRGKIKYTVHTLVLIAFVGPRGEHMDACHNNGCPDDARLENLRWDTKKANQHDRIKHGTSKEGVKHPMAKLSENDIRDIRSDLRHQRIIAKKFGISQTQVSRIKNGLRWSCLEK